MTHQSDVDAQLTRVEQIARALAAENDAELQMRVLKAQLDGNAPRTAEEWDQFKRWRRTVEALEQVSDR